MRGKGARNWAIFLGGLAAVLLPYLPLLSDSGTALLFRDLTNDFLPAKAVWVRAVRELGHVPLWNPFLSGGTPFLTDPSVGALYPFNFFLLLFPVSQLARGLVWLILLEHAVLYSGAYALFREWRCRAGVAALGGIALALCGYAMSSDYILHELGSLLAVPLYLLCLTRYARRAPVSPYAFAAALFLAWPVYAGNPEYAYVMALIAPLFLLRRPWRPALLRVAALGALAVLVAAPQLFPTLAHLSAMHREQDAAAVQDAFRLAWSLRPARALELLFPYGLGRSLGDPAQWVRGLVDSENQALPFLLSLYAGASLAAPLFLLAPAWLTGRRPRRRLVRPLAAVLVAFLLALGRFSPVPLYSLFDRVLPLWSGFRYPERLFTWVGIAWILLSVLALERALRLRHLGEKGFGAAAALWAAAAAAFVLLLRGSDGVGVGASLAHGAVFFFASLGVLALGRRLRPTASLALLAVLVTADFGLSAHALVWPQALAFLQPSTFVSKILQDRATRTDADARRVYAYDTAGTPPNQPDFETAGKWAFLLFNTPAYWGLESPQGFFALQDHRTLLDELPDPSLRRKVLDLLSVRYFLVRNESGAKVLVNTEAQPYALVPAHLEWRSSREAVLARLRDSAFSPLGAAVLLGEGGEATQAGWQVDGVEKRYDHLRVRLHAANGARGPAWLLVNESYSPQWRATAADGTALPIVTANAWSMAVQVPENTREIEFVYSEPAFTWGLWALVLWCGLLLGCMVYTRARAPERA